MKNKQVWVLVIHTGEGPQVTVHRTEAGAKAELLEFVDEWFPFEFPDEEIPADKDDRVTAYFEYSRETSDPEGYDLELKDVQD